MTSLPPRAGAQAPSRNVAVVPRAQIPVYLSKEQSFWECCLKRYAKSAGFAETRHGEFHEIVFLPYSNEIY
jgi:hypothetical protein